MSKSSKSSRTSTKKKKVEMRRCYSCKAEYEDNGRIFCKKCEDKPDRAKSSISTFVIYNKL